MKNSHSIRITIPQPCSMKWEEMKRVDENRRHCFSCNRELTDFSAMNDDELVLYFKHSRGNICGAFSPSQLDRTITLLPEHSVKTKWWKAALLFPLTFFAGKIAAQTTQDTVQHHPPVTHQLSPKDYLEAIEDTLVSDSLDMVTIVGKRDDGIVGIVVGKLPAQTPSTQTSVVKAGFFRRCSWRTRNFFRRMFHH